MVLVILLVVSNLITAAILCTTCCIQYNAMSHIKKFIKDYFSSRHVDNSSAEKKAPEYLKGLQDQEVIEGNEVSFRCKLSGYPQPRVIWYKDGKKLKNCGQHKIGKKLRFISLFKLEIFLISVKWKHLCLLILLLVWIKDATAKICE